jgi:type IX secretion system PorP/SprF family membrane protein
MNKFITIIILFVSAVVVRAQQIPHYSQYWLNDFVLNPAIAGTKNYFEAKSNNRYQWIGITDAPRTYILSLNGPIVNERMGVGGYVFTDIVGPTRRTGGYGSYGYKVSLSDNIKLSMGLSAGVLQFAVDAAKINLRDEFDPALSNGLQSVVVPDASFGFLVYTDKKWYLGVTANQLFNNRLKFFEQKDLNSNTNRLALHATAMAGYRFYVNDDFAVEPSVFIKYVSPVPVQIDGSLRFIYKDKLWAGGTFRTNDAIVASIGYLMNNNLIFGYSYDYSTSNLRNYSSGTHELMIGVRFYKKRVPPSVAPLNTVPANDVIPSSN